MDFFEFLLQEIDALQSDLLVSQAQIHQLENQLEDTKKEQIEVILY